MFEFTIHGTRGTLPACGAEYLGYGGSTTCFSMRGDQGWLILDAGTGITHINRNLRAHRQTPPLAMLFTHFHIDHLFGLPCFEPLYQRRAQLSIYGDPRRSVPWRECLRTFMGKPFWPVGLGEADAAMELRDLPLREQHLDLFGMRVSWCDVPHPQQCLAYRITVPGWSVAVATDVEWDESTEAVPGFLDLCRDVDYLLMDAQFTPHDYPSHRGWGHSSWRAAIAIARQCNAKQLVLIHHAPERTDAEIRAIQDAARLELPGTIAGAENMSWNGPAGG